MPIVIETREEFIQRHGGMSKAARTGNLTLFPDGAVMNDDSGLQHEPPDDDYSLLALKRDHAKALLEKVRDQFDQLKDYCVTQSQWAAMNAGPLPSEEALDDLKTLRKKVALLRSDFSTLEEKLARHPKNRDYRSEVLQKQREHATSLRRRALLEAREVAGEDEDIGPDDGSDV